MTILKHIFFFLLVSLPLTARSDSLDAFPIKASITPQEEGHSFYQFTLTRSVYETLSGRERSEIRLYNKEGEAIPFLIENHGPEDNIEDYEATESLNFFPLYEDALEQEDHLNVLFKTNRQGTILEFNQKNKEAKPEQKIRGYIVDLSAFNLKKYPLTYLLFHWQTNNKSFARSLNIEASSDLENWSTIRKGATINEFSYQGHHLIKNKIPLVILDDLYLKFTWRKDKDLPLTKLEGVFKRTRTTSPTYNSLDIAPLKKNNELIYNLKGPFPITALSLTALPLNTVLSGSWFSCTPDPQTKNCDAQPLPHFSNQLYYNIVVDQEYVTHADKDLDKSGQPFNMEPVLIFRPNDKQALVKGLAPSLQVDWSPAKIIFLAQGEGPYTLAYGKKDLTDYPLRKTDELKELLKDQSKFPSATLGELQIDKELLAEEIKGEPDPAEIKKTYALWGTLILGLAFLGFLTSKLIKQMKETK